MRDPLRIVIFIETRERRTAGSAGALACSFRRLAEIIFGPRLPEVIGEDADHGRRGACAPRTSRDPPSHEESYSLRKAITGSSLAARFAGIQHASNATSESTPVTLAIVTIS